MYLPVTSYLYHMQTLFSWASNDTFSKPFSYLHHWLPVQHHHFFFDHALYNLKHITLLVFPCFHSFHILQFSLTLILTSFHHHVSLCLIRPFVHSQFLSVASTKLPKLSNNFQQNHLFDYLIWTGWSMTWNHSLHCLYAVSIAFCWVHTSSWYLLLSLS